MGTIYISKGQEGQVDETGDPRGLKRIPPDGKKTFPNEPYWEWFSFHA
jgi:hypothetical protein